MSESNARTAPVGHRRRRRRERGSTRRSASGEVPVKIPIAERDVELTGFGGLCWAEIVVLEVLLRAELDALFGTRQQINVETDRLGRSL